MSGHTPGPWQAVVEVEQFEHDGTSYLIWGVKIPPVAPVKFGQTVYPLKKEDAHLIAAAPELLLACQAVKCALEGPASPSHEMFQLTEAYRAIVAAIVKAEGRE